MNRKNLTIETTPSLIHGDRAVLVNAGLSTVCGARDGHLRKLFDLPHHGELKQVWFTLSQRASTHAHRVMFRFCSNNGRMLYRTSRYHRWSLLYPWACDLMRDHFDPPIDTPFTLHVSLDYSVREGG